MSRNGLLIILCAAQLVFIGFVALRAAAVKQENAQLSAAAVAPPPQGGKNEKLELLLKENARLTAALATIPSLTEERESLLKKADETAHEATAAWGQLSNDLQRAIEEKKAAIAQIESSAKELEKTKSLEKAAARMAEKAAQGPMTDAEITRLEGVLAKVAAGTKEMIERRKAWAKTEKTPATRDAHKQAMGTAWSELEGAVKELGADSALFEELPLNGTDIDYATTPLYRSVVPDSRGMKATLYLDGRVVWSR